MALDQSALTDLLDALRAGGDLDFMREAMQLVLQALIDLEATHHIGAAPYERSEARTTHRNGSRARLLSTKAGDVELAIPKLRSGSFFPSLLEPRRRIDRALWAVVMEAFVHGVSTRKVDDLVTALGIDAGVSKSQVSRICSELDGAVASFAERRLDYVEFPYLFLDATYVKAHEGPQVVSKAIVVATGVAADGHREVLGLAVGNSEDKAFWTSFLRSLRARGLSGVRLVISDAHEGLKGAIAAVMLGTACWPRCPGARPRWWRRRCAPSSPSPMPLRWPTSSTTTRRWEPRPTSCSPAERQKHRRRRSCERSHFPPLGGHGPVLRPSPAPGKRRPRSARGRRIPSGAVPTPPRPPSQPSFRTVVGTAVDAGALWLCQAGLAPSCSSDLAPPHDSGAGCGIQASGEAATACRRLVDGSSH